MNINSKVVSFCLLVGLVSLFLVPKGFYIVCLCRAPVLEFVYIEAQT